jgi:hypothetical protein
LIEDERQASRSLASMRMMRVTHYEITRQADGGRLVVITVQTSRRRFVVTRRQGSARIRLAPSRAVSPST